MSKEPSDRKDSLLVFSILLALSFYHLVQRLATGELIGIDGNAMQIATHAVCELPSTWSGIQFTPIYTCVYVLLAYVFESPLVYLLTTVVLKFLTFFGLYRIYLLLARSYGKTSNPELLAISCLIFFLVGGVARLQINGDLILKSGIYTGMWAQLVLVYALATFLSKRYLISGILVGLAVFLHPANSIHVFVVAFFALVVVEGRENLPMSIFKFAPVPFLALVVQYIAAYGIPFATAPESASVANVAAANVGGSEYSVTEWYQYILSQDPDDLSLFWNLSSISGAFYFIFGVVGLAIAFRTPIDQSSRKFLSRPEIAIPVAWFGYIAICLLVELLAWPEIFLKQLIVIQPRRAFYLPIIFLSFFVVQYLTSFFLMSGRVPYKSAMKIVLFLIGFGIFLLTSGKGNNAEPATIMVVLSLSFLMVATKYYLSNQPDESFGAILYEMFKSRSMWIMGILLILIMRFSTFMTPVGAHNFKITFLDSNSRSYSDYIVLQAEATGKGLETREFLHLSRWVGENIDRTEHIITAGLLESEVMLFEILNRRAVQSMNVYRYRGLMHFDKTRFDELIRYHESLLGISASEMTRSDGTIIDRLQELIEGFKEEKFCELTTPAGERFGYFITTYRLSIDIPLVFQANKYRVYDLEKLRANSPLC